MKDIRTIMQVSPIIPVAVIPSSVDETKLAQALILGGIPIIEVTLRTPGAINTISSISEKVSAICVGAGTVWTAEDAEAVIDNGAEFIVSPAYVDKVHQVCLEKKIPYLPGVQTVTEAAHCVNAGLTALKLFPANLSGGPAIIKAISSVLPNLMFCPTGGINKDSAPDYLSLSTVPCVGGSWVLDSEAIRNEDWIKMHADVKRALQEISSV